MMKLITEEPSQAYEAVRQFEFEQFFQCIYQCGNSCTNHISYSIKNGEDYHIDKNDHYLRENPAPWAGSKPIVDLEREFQFDKGPYLKINVYLIHHYYLAFVAYDSHTFSIKEAQVIQITSLRDLLNRLINAGAPCEACDYLLSNLITRDLEPVKYIRMYTQYVTVPGGPVTETIGDTYTESEAECAHILDSFENTFKANPETFVHVERTDPLHLFITSKDAEGNETNSCYWFNKIKQRDYLE